MIKKMSEVFLKLWSFQMSLRGALRSVKKNPIRDKFLIFSIKITPFPEDLFKDLENIYTYESSRSTIARMLPSSLRWDI